MVNLDLSAEKRKKRSIRAAYFIFTVSKCKGFTQSCTQVLLSADITLYGDVRRKGYDLCFHRHIMYEP